MQTDIDWAGWRLGAWHCCELSIALYSHSVPRASQWQSGGSEGRFFALKETRKGGKREKKEERSRDHKSTTEWEPSAGANPPRDGESQEAAITVQQLPTYRDLKVRVFLNQLLLGVFLLLLLWDFS